MPDTIRIRDDGTVTDDGDPLADAYVRASALDELRERLDGLLAQNESLRCDFLRVAAYYPWPAQRARMERRVIADEPTADLDRLRAEAVAALRFPVRLRKTWTGAEVQQWLEDESHRLMARYRQVSDPDGAEAQGALTEAKGPAR